MEEMSGEEGPPSRPRSQPVALPTVSVVVSTLGRRQPLLDVLSDLFAQDYPSFDIAVVDQNEQPLRDVVELARTAQTPVQVFHLRPPHLCVARNAGIQATRGELLVFVDDDVRCQPDFLRSHAEAYREGIAGAGGWVEARDPSWSWYPEGPESRRLAGCNMSFRRCTVEQLGGFDTTFRPPLAYGDEMEFCHRVIRRGLRIAVTPKARVVHCIEPGGGLRLKDPGVYWPAFVSNFVFLFLKTRPWTQRLLLGPWTGKLWFRTHRMSNGALSAKEFLRAVQHGRRMVEESEQIGNHLAATPRASLVYSNGQGEAA